MLMGDVDQSELSKAPKILQDELLFPYLAGIKFSQHVFAGVERMADFHKVLRGLQLRRNKSCIRFVFAKHRPRKSRCPIQKLDFRDWKKLEETIWGIRSGNPQAISRKDRATIWPRRGQDATDVRESKEKRTMLLFQVAWERAAAAVFKPYSELLELKYDQRTICCAANYFSL